MKPSILSIAHRKSFEIKSQFESNFKYSGLLLDVVVNKGTTILGLVASKVLTPPRGLRSCRC
jgi:hypothetical protein